MRILNSNRDDDGRECYFIYYIDSFVDEIGLNFDLTKAGKEEAQDFVNACCDKVQILKDRKDLIPFLERCVLLATYELYIGINGYTKENGFPNHTLEKFTNEYYISRKDYRFLMHGIVRYYTHNHHYDLFNKDLIPKSKLLKSKLSKCKISK